MGYEYKEILKVAVRDFLSGNLEQDSETGEYLNLGEVEENYSDISIELDHVYAQAAKADEYEKGKYRTHVNDRKAEAFDAILKSYDEALSEGHMADDVCNIVEKYESGEPNVKK